MENITFSLGNTKLEVLILWEADVTMFVIDTLAFFRAVHDSVLLEHNFLLIVVSLFVEIISIVLVGYSHLVIRSSLPLI